MSNIGRRGYVTIDTERARKILREAGRTFTKQNRRTVARPAAKILQDDMRSGSGGIIPISKKPYHIFQRPGYKVTIKRGNLRKSHTMLSFRRSGLMWVGPRYMVARNGMTIGETYRTSDGFYDKMYMKKSGNDFAGRAILRKTSEITNRLIADADKWLKRIVSKANATP